MKSGTIIEISNLIKIFNSKRVLDNVTCSIGEGCTGLVGLSGAGKTTLIKILVGLLNQESGSVKIFGNESSSIKARERICYLPERVMIPSNITGLEFVKINAGMHGVRVSTKEVEAMSESVGLDVDSLRSTSESYSKGMMQKIGIIYCLLSASDIAILDEPMTGLDPKSRVMVKNAIKDLVKIGKSVVFSSHFLYDVDSLCKNICLVKDSKVIKTDITSFKKEYKNQDLEQAFLAFLGDKNFSNKQRF